MTGWDTGLSQDYNGDLGRWFADRLGAREQLRRDMTVLTHEEAKALHGKFRGDVYELIRETEALVEKKLALRAQPMRKATRDEKIVNPGVYEVPSGVTITGVVTDKGMFPLAKPLGVREKLEPKFKAGDLTIRED